MKQVALPNGKLVTYKYDALGRRIERSATIAPPLPLTTTTRFIYDSQDVIRDTDGSGLTTANYLNGPGIDNKLRQSVGAAALYFVQDQLGSTRALTDGNGNVIEQPEYDSFGNSPSSNLTRYGYTGRERDGDTGQLYYRARFYDPQVGKFISEDPIEFEGGDVNLYAYVQNNPLIFTDPEGTQGRSDRNFYPSDRNPQTGDGYGIYRRRVTPGCPSGGWGVVGALGDFWGNYSDMRTVNTVGADKYFHCLANCEASRRGWSARKTAQIISEAREIFDRNVKGYPKEDCEADRHANNVGRIGGLGCRPCREVCAQFKPAGLKSPQRPVPKPVDWNNRSWGGGGKGW